ncbi:hypothetical protein RFI_13381, partial [Reticulomyxa filosa]
GVCFDFQKHGYCRRGNNCRYQHIREMNSMTVANMEPSQNSAAGLGILGNTLSGMKKSSDICYEFEQKGTCQWGAQCRYKHISKETNDMSADAISSLSHNFVVHTGTGGNVISIAMGGSAGSGSSASNINSSNGSGSSGSGNSGGSGHMTKDNELNMSAGDTATMTTTVSANASTTAAAVMYANSGKGDYITTEIETDIKPELDGNASLPDNENGGFKSELASMGGGGSGSGGNKLIGNDAIGMTESLPSILNVQTTNVPPT